MGKCTGPSDGYRHKNWILIQDKIGEKDLIIIIMQRRNTCSNAGATAKTRKVVRVMIECRSKLLIC